MSNEVEEWLYTLGLPDFYLYFEEDGWTTLDAVSLMTEDDVKAIVKKRGHVAILLKEIDRLRFNNSNSRNNPANDVQPQDNEIDFYDDFSVAQQRRNSRSVSRGASRARSAPPKTLDEMYAPYIYAKYGIHKKYGRAGNNLFTNGMSYLDQVDVNQERVDRGRFRDHYSNNYVWVEKNHVNDVGVRYDGLSRKVDQKPSHWRCEDEIERGRELRRINDECGDKISDNRNSIDNSRDWLVDDGGVVQRIHKMSAAHAKTKYDLNTIKRNMDNIKAMKLRLLQ